MNSLGHVGVNVPDLELATRVFGDGLGLEVSWRSSVSDPHGDSMQKWLGLNTDAEGRFTFFRAGSGVEIEAIEWNRQSRNRDTLAADHRGHLALWVDDLDATVRKLAGLGCTIYDPHPSGFVYARTSWGQYLQLMPRSRG
ncbi:VOC family protein [Nocardia xishanensis]